MVVLKNWEPEFLYILAELFNMCLKETCFSDCWKFLLGVPILKIVGERSTAKNYHPVSLLSVVSKVFKKLVINRIVDHFEKCGLFSEIQYGFRSSQSAVNLLLHLIYPRLLRQFGILVFLTNVSLMEFQVRYLALFLFFLVIDGFRWFWMGNLKNIQLILEFLKGPFLVLQFSYYTSMTFLMMLSIILLSVLMILLSTLIMIRHLICGNN